MTDIQIIAPHLGFAAIVELKMITPDIHEVERVIRALDQAGYKMRFRNAMAEPHPDGVFIGEYTMIRDVSKPEVAAAPQADAPTPKRKSKSLPGPSGLAGSRQRPGRKRRGS